MACCSFAENSCFQRASRWSMFGLTILAWVFSVTTLAVCNFLKLEYEYGDGEFEYQYVSYPPAYLYDGGPKGLFKYDFLGECEPYDDDYDLDGAHKAGKAFGILANLCLVFAFVGITLIIFFLTGKAAKIVWISTRILYVMALLMVLLTFVVLASEECTVEGAECSLGAGGVINALNVIVLVAIVSVCWCTPVPPEPVIKCHCSSPGTPAAQSTKETNVTDENLARAEVVGDQALPSSSPHELPEHLLKLQA